MTPKKLRPGDTIHVLSERAPAIDPSPPGTSTPIPMSLHRGQTVCLTENMIQNSRDRTGASWLDLVDDEEAQVSRWGEIMFRRGEAPAGMSRHERGSVSALIAREHERAAAHQQHAPGPALRAALTEIDERLGRPAADSGVRLSGGH